MLANSFLLRHGRTIHEGHPDDWQLNQNFKDKTWASLYLIARDFSRGEFPPRFTDQQETYKHENDYLQSIPGADFAQTIAKEMRKPFWPSEAPWLSGVGQYLNSLLFLLRCFSEAGVKPPAKLLELGCGSGWMAEFLALYGYSVVATTLASTELEIARRRADLLQAKACGAQLKIIGAAMETVSRDTAGEMPFDAVFVHEALHHAFDWKATVAEVHRTLRVGGQFFICQEPNAAHTYICYRSAKILKTHEIGFHKSELVRVLKETGFSKVTVLRPWLNNFVSPFWICAKK
jgi:2-polyprenyl-3-methyl-5-hydroxy-6-metoxy-1,4-benzoquinol methylase